MVVGSSVFVCDNLSFSGEIRVARKHTTNIFRDLPGKITEGIGRLSNLWVSQARRFEAYKETPLNDSRDVHDLLFRAMLCNAATVTQLKHVYEEFQTPTHEEFRPRNVWSLFNSFTQVGKENNLNVVPSRTMALHGLLDGFCGVISKEAPIAVEAN
jgi:hypothetical protein